jgi:4-amino-4-deoxy-L-arabinose transferase-like glycosyltransferase
MYNDGIWYAILSKNLANGIGSFWQPRLTETIFPVFHEHPPLVFGLQSLFFRLLGDGIFTEKFYTLLTFIISANLIVLIWRQVFRGSASLQSLWFIPLTLWLLNEVTTHFYPNNMLENTMGVFCLIAMLCLLISLRVNGIHQILLIILSALSVFAATLSKGVVALFPLGFFVIHWLVFRSFSFKSLVKRTGILVAVYILCFIVLLSFDTNYESLKYYSESQIFASITSARTEYHYHENRFYIIIRLLELLSPAIILTLILYLLLKRVNNTGFPSGKWAWCWLFIGLSATLPIAISPKQSWYYLLPGMPYFALGLGIFLAEKTADGLQAINTASWKYKLFLGITIVLLLFGMVFSAAHTGSVNRRDRIVLSDVQKIGSVVPKNRIIGSEVYDSYLVAYLYRLHNISIDTTDERSYHYLVTTKETDSAGQYTRSALKTDRFHLFEKEQD